MSALTERYETMHNNGVAAIQAGNVPLFREVPTSLKQRWNTAFILEPSQDYSNLFQVLEQMEKSIGTKFFLAGRDYPIHATLQEALGKENAGKKPDTDYSYIEKTFLETTFSFGYLLADKGNVILAAEPIPEDVLASRRKLSESFLQNGLEPLPLPILHITVERIRYLHEQKEKVLDEYLEALLAVREEIKNKPITLAVKNIHRGWAYDLLSAS